MNVLLRRRIYPRLLRCARSRSSTYCKYASVALDVARLEATGIYAGSRRTYVRYPG
jgi:hypothetical protein